MQRIFVIDGLAAKLKNNKSLQSRLCQELNAGVEVRCLDGTAWPSGEQADFAVIDDGFLCGEPQAVIDNGLRPLALWAGGERPKQRQKQFDQLWKSAQSPSDELQKQCAEAAKAS